MRLKPKWKQLQQKLDYYFSSGRKKEPARVRLHKKISIHTNTNTYKERRTWLNENTQRRNTEGIKKRKGITAAIGKQQQQQ